MNRSFLVDESVTLSEALNRVGLKPQSMNTGTQEIKCPMCQGFHPVFGASSYDPSDNPLSLTIKDATNALWHCHNCGWTSCASKEGKKLIKYKSPDLKKRGERRNG